MILYICLIVMILNSNGLNRGYSKIKSVSLKANLNSNTGLFPFSERQLQLDSNKKLIKKSATIASIIAIPILLQSYGLINKFSISNINIMHDGIRTQLKQYLGDKATLIVNIASNCALTPQCDELLELYDKFNTQGFQIIATTSNQFTSQNSIKKSYFGGKIPVIENINVNGLNSHELYQKMKYFSNNKSFNSQVSEVSWNFEKFLVNKDGIPVRRYKPGIKPSFIEDDIKSLVVNDELPKMKRPTLTDLSSNLYSF